MRESYVYWASILMAAMELYVSYFRGDTKLSQIYPQDVEVPGHSHRRDGGE